MSELVSYKLCILSFPKFGEIYIEATNNQEKVLEGSGRVWNCVRTNRVGKLQVISPNDPMSECSMNDFKSDVAFPTIWYRIGFVWKHHDARKGSQSFCNMHACLAFDKWCKIYIFHFTAFKTGYTTICQKICTFISAKPKPLLKRIHYISIHNFSNSYKNSLPWCGNLIVKRCTNSLLPHCL